MKKLFCSIILACFVTTQASALPLLKADVMANKNQSQLTQIAANADESLKPNGKKRKVKGNKQNNGERKAKRKQKREERKAKRQDKGQERQANRQDNRQERKANRQEKRKERKANRQQKRQKNKSNRNS